MDQERIIIVLEGDDIKIKVEGHEGSGCLDVTREFLEELNGGEPLAPGQFELTNEYQQNQTARTSNVAKRRQ